MFMLRKKTELPSAADALPGRPTPIPTATKHFINQRPLKGPYPEGPRRRCSGSAASGAPSASSGSWATAFTSPRSAMPPATRPIRPTRRSAAAAPATTRSCWWSTIRRRFPTSSCSRPSGKATIRPRACARATTSARSIAPASTSPATPSAKPREASKAMYEKALKGKGFDAITTEILDAPPFYFAEDYHQQYLAKNPMGYCGLGGTGVSCPIGTGVAAQLTASCQPRALIRHRRRAYACFKMADQFLLRPAITADIASATYEEPAMPKFERVIETILFQSRWTLAPFYLGLAFCLLLMLFHFVPRAVPLRRQDSGRDRSRRHPRRARADRSHLHRQSGADRHLLRLREFRVEVRDRGDHDRPDWMTKVDFGGLKQKLMTSIVAISAIQVLKAFMNIDQASRRAGQHQARLAGRHPRAVPGLAAGGRDRRPVLRSGKPAAEKPDPTQKSAGKA